MDDSSRETRSARKRKAEDLSQLGMSTVRKHQKREKRRSSFMRGRSRKSLPPVNIECSELHQKIPTDVPEDKRLEQLKQACFEYTMQKLAAEIPLFESDRDLQCKVRKAFESTLTDVAGSGILAQACTKNSFEPNPSNLEMNEVVIKIQSHIRRLSEESDKWDQLLQHHADLAQEAQKFTVSSEDPKTVTKTPDSLTMKQRRLLSDLPDLTAIMDWTRCSAEEVALQIEKIHDTSRQMAAFKNSMENYLQHELQNFAVDSFDGYQDIGDPRTLLMKAGTNVHSQSADVGQSSETVH